MCQSECEACASEIEWVQGVIVSANEACAREIDWVQEAIVSAIMCQRLSG